MYFCINRRPVELPKLAKGIRETYQHVTGCTNSVSCVLQLHIAPQLYNINLVPDKRTVAFCDENLVHDAICNRLRSVWEQQQLDSGTNGGSSIGIPTTKVVSLHPEASSVAPAAEYIEEDVSRSDDVFVSPSPPNKRRKVVVSDAAPSSVAKPSSDNTEDSLNDGNTSTLPTLTQEPQYSPDSSNCTVTPSMSDRRQCRAVML